MRTFAQKQHQSQKQASLSLARSNTAAPRRDHRANLILQSQRPIGNQAVQPMLQTNAEEFKAGLTGTASPRFGYDFSRIPIHSPTAGAIQTKLAISKPRDVYENEADRVAEQVMHLHEPQLQRACPCDGECPKCQTEQPSQEHERLRTKRAQASDTGQIAASPIVHEVLAAPGQPLDPATRGFMESRFGHDFSHVRVHTDTRAAESAREVNALAYTVGPDVVLGAGQYAPATNAGQRLLAHELTHVIQQGGNARALQQDSKFSEENDHYEQEAERSAAQCMSGAQVQVPSRVWSPLIQRTKVCSKPLDNPLGRWPFRINHSYIDDTGSDNCKGNDQVGNYAIQTLYSGNFLNGCALKTATSTDPQKYTPNVKQCDPKPGVKDLSKCLRDTYDSYADPSVYKNPKGPNSNTFAATLAKTCCADGSSTGLGTVPGWDHDPAPPCVFEAGVEESPKEEVPT
jgi:hypothetical protein